MHNGLLSFRQIKIRHFLKCNLEAFRQIKLCHQTSCHMVLNVNIIILTALLESIS